VNQLRGRGEVWPRLTIRVEMADHGPDSRVGIADTGTG
jgi:hypothetical protein